MTVFVSISLNASNGNKCWYDLAKCGADTSVKPVKNKNILKPLRSNFAQRTLYLW